MKHLFENHDLVTEHGSQLIDVTDDVKGAVQRADVVNGMALVYSPHTTCAIVINELESGILEDLSAMLETLAPQANEYRHDEADRRATAEGGTPHPANGHSHVRAGLLASSSQTLPIVDRELVLGRYQRIFFCELDCSRPRKVLIQVIGE